MKKRNRYKRVKGLFGEYEEIPEEWGFSILNKLTLHNDQSSIRMGPFGSSLKKHELLDEGKIKTIWIENIVNNEFSWEYQKYISEEKYKQLGNFTVKPNDLLITMMGTLGRVAIVPKDIDIAIISSHLLKITLDNDKMISEYLYYFLKSNFAFRQITKESRGMVMGGLNTKIIKNLWIIIPTILEQQKIASILSNVDALIQNTQQVVDKAGRLKKGLMQELLIKGIKHDQFKKIKGLFGKEIEIPEDWEIKKINEIGEIITGNTPSTDNQEYYGNEYLWVSPSDINQQKFIDNTNSKLSRKGFEVCRSIPKYAVLIVCIGSTIGKIVIASKQMSTNQQINSIICKQFDPEFVYYQILKNNKLIKNISNQAAVPILNKTDFGIIKIIIPTNYEEQTKIASILSGVDAYIQKNQEYKKHLELLKKGLMQKLLTGKIRVKV